MSETREHFERLRRRGGKQIVQARSAREDRDVAEAFVRGDVIDEDLQHQRNRHARERGAGDGGEEKDHGFGVAAKHDAVFGEELLLLAFEDVLDVGRRGVAAAGVGGVRWFLGGVGVAKGVEEAFADFIAELGETLAAGFHPVGPVRMRIWQRGIVAGWVGGGRGGRGGQATRRQGDKVRG